VDRVRECMDAGILRPGDPVQVSLTMWAHAHGLISLYHGRHFPMDEAAFRRLFDDSGRRMIVGLATADFVDAHAEHASVESVGANA